MKLIKLKDDHYVVVDDSKEIKTDDKYLTSDNRIVNWYQEFEENIKENRPSPITHSTQPLEKFTYDNLSDEVFSMDYYNIKPLSLQEVKELINEVDVEKKAREEYKDNLHNPFFTAAPMGYVKGYNQALEDNKEKKYTEEDMKEVYEFGLMNKYKSLEVNNDNFRYYLSLQPKTEWEVELVDGKLKLK
jgi:hypothetical protein